MPALKCWKDRSGRLHHAETNKFLSKAENMQAKRFGYQEVQPPAERRRTGRPRIHPREDDIQRGAFGDGRPLPLDQPEDATFGAPPAPQAVVFEPIDTGPSLGERYDGAAPKEPPSSGAAVNLDGAEDGSHGLGPDDDIERCGDPDCAHCAFRYKICPVSGKPIRPKPSLDATRTHAAMLLGMIAVGVSKRSGVTVQGPNLDEVDLVAKPLAGLEWRYAGKLQEYEDIFGFIGAVGYFAFTRASAAAEESAKRSPLVDAAE